MGWPDVTIALIAALPAVIAALASLSNRQSLKTPSGTTVGKQVESAHQTTIASNYRLQALGDESGVTMPVKAAAEEAHVAELNGEVEAKP